MAELILSAVSLGLAVPGIVVAFQECGKYVADKVQAFKNAPAILKELQVIGLEFYEGQLKIDIDISEQAFRSDEHETILRKSLDRHVKALAARLLEARKFLEDISIANTLQKLWFIALHERRARDIIKGLRKEQKDFLGAVQILLASRQLLPDKLYLNRSRLMAINNATTIFGVSQVLSIGKCEYKSVGAQNQILELDVLFERFDDASGTEEQVQTIATHLTRHFRQQPRYRGILPCLGYRKIPQYELCFQLPSENFVIQSLHALINQDAQQAGIFQRRLEDRFALALAVSEAVLSVAATGFVHKSIRSNTILLLQSADAQQTNAIGTPFLTHWQLLRKATDLSKRWNPGSEWEEDVYRHPKRYGIQPQQRYDIGHDVYSLGVCLLEIGLWSTLSIPDTTNAHGPGKPATYFHNAAAEYFNADPATFDLTAHFRYPEKTRDILIAIAEKNLPSRMGTAYTELVLKCLKAVEGGFGPDIDFSKMSTVDAAVFFNDEVLASFPGLTTI